MKNITRLITTSAAPAIIILSFRHDTTAPYLDAGTASILLQALLGGLVALIVALKLYWNRVKNFVKKLSSREKT